MLFTRFLFAIALPVWASSPSAWADMAYTFGTGPNQFTMTMVPIGSLLNPPDTTGNPNPTGAVSYNYQIGKYEVSEDMINKFNASQALQITKDTRGTDKPATSVSWNEAARFTNWLNTSTGGFAAYKFTTSGVNDNIALWTVADTLDYSPANPFRSLRSNYVLPSIDEWYKAAYYDPNTNTYYNYPTGSDTAPIKVASGTSPGTAVFYEGTLAGPADVNNAGGLSPFGAMALGGNVWEMQETESDLVNNNAANTRKMRGGYYGESFTSGALSTVIADVNVDTSNFYVGFRVASLDFTAVPEPSSFLGAVSLALGGLLYRRKRRPGEIS